MARKPKPRLYVSALRPTCPPVQHGVAVSERDRWTFVRLHAAGLSYAAISRLPFIGRCARTVRAICKRWATAHTVQRRPTGGRANCPPILDVCGGIQRQAQCALECWELRSKPLHDSGGRFLLHAGARAGAARNAPGTAPRVPLNTTKSC